MNNSFLTHACPLVIACMISAPTHAELQPRDLNKDNIPDAYYDTVLDITWLKDANLIASNSFGLSYGTDLGPHPADVRRYANNVILSSGKATWGAAMHWIDAMNASRYLGYGDWRLPFTKDAGPRGVVCRNADTDCGYNVLTVDPRAHPVKVYSELAYMYYVNLANRALYDPQGKRQSGYGLVDDVANPQDDNLFSNIQRAYYWSGSPFEFAPHDAWAFAMYSGYQTVHGKPARYHAWPVRPGDSGVPIAPAPATDKPPFTIKPSKD